jgi:hypothetical protein
MPGRAIAMLALAIPVLAGLAYLYAFGAPRSYVAVNAAALAMAAAWIGFARRPPRGIARQVAMAVLLLLLFLPLLTGPSLSGVARWLPLGPFQLHAGMLAIPLLAVLAGEAPEDAPLLLSIALLAAFLQPDMASGAALMLAAVGLHEATRDWRHGLFAIVAFTASIVAAMRGELPAEPFVERVIFSVARVEPLAAVGLLMALVASFYLIVAALPGSETSRKALAGSLFGFAFAGLVSNYPSVLIGYGASPILGFGLALGLLARRPRQANSH